MPNYLKEAFKELELLNEETFSFDKDGAAELKKFYDGDTTDDYESIIDPEAETKDELEDSYEGKVIIACKICHGMQYKDPQDIVIDEESDYVNVGEECPACSSVDGYKVVGQVAPYCAECDEESEDAEVETTAVESLSESYVKVGNKRYPISNRITDVMDVTRKRPHLKGMLEEVETIRRVVDDNIADYDLTEHASAARRLRHFISAVFRIDVPQPITHLIIKDGYLVDSFTALHFRFPTIPDLILEVRVFGPGENELTYVLEDAPSWEEFNRGGSIYHYVERTALNIMGRIHEVQDEAEETKSKGQEESLNEKRKTSRVIESLKSAPKRHFKESLNEEKLTTLFDVVGGMLDGTMDRITINKKTGKKQAVGTKTPYEASKDIGVDDDGYFVWVADEAGAKYAQEVADKFGLKTKLDAPTKYISARNNRKFHIYIPRDRFDEPVKQVVEESCGKNNTRRRKKAKSRIKEALDKTVFTDELLDKVKKEIKSGKRSDATVDIIEQVALEGIQDFFGDVDVESNVQAGRGDYRVYDAEGGYRSWDAEEDEEALDDAILNANTWDDAVADYVDYLDWAVMYHEPDYDDDEYDDDDDEYDDDDEEIKPRIVSEESYQAFIKLLDEYLDNEIESEIVEHQRMYHWVPDDYVMLVYAMKNVFFMLPINTQRELVPNLDHVAYAEMINLLKPEDLERYIDKVRTIKRRLGIPLKESYDKDTLIHDILSKLKQEGYDVRGRDARAYADGAAELIMISPDGYTVDKWFEDTKRNHSKDLLKFKKFSDLKESVKNVKVETDSDTVTVTPTEGGDVKVETKSKKTIEPGAETIVPVDAETKDEIDMNDHNFDETDADIDIDSIDDEGFDVLGESYLKKVYENVKSFKTSSSSIKDGKLMVEGMISFNSGKKAKTSFVFESISKTKRGKIKFLGENLNFSKSKSAFTLIAKPVGKKAVCESLTYNYVAKDSKSNKKLPVYGKVSK